jgi:P27 family predicted phage terminase small subunit
MGERGPQKKPTALRVLHGDEPRTINTAEPAYAKGTPVCPGDMPDAGRVLWSQVVPELARVGMLALVDAAAIETTCRVYAAMADAWDAYGGRVTVTNDSGNVVTNPALVAWRTLAREFRGYIHEFGFTPGSRAGMIAPAAGGDDDELKRIIG